MRRFGSLHTFCCDTWRSKWTLQDLQLANWITTPVEFWEAFSGWIMKASNSYDDSAGPFFEEFNTALHSACWKEAQGVHRVNPFASRWWCVNCLLHLRSLLLADLSKVVGVGISVHRKHLQSSPLKPIQSPAWEHPDQGASSPFMMRSDSEAIWLCLYTRLPAFTCKVAQQKITANGPMAWKVMSFPFVSHRQASSTTLLVGSRRGLNFSKSWTYRSHHGPSRASRLGRLQPKTYRLDLLVCLLVDRHLLSLDKNKASFPGKSKEESNSSKVLSSNILFLGSEGTWQTCQRNMESTSHIPYPAPLSNLREGSRSCVPTKQSKPWRVNKQHGGIAGIAMNSALDLK